MAQVRIGFIRRGGFPYELAMPLKVPHSACSEISRPWDWLTGIVAGLAA